MLTERRAARVVVIDERARVLLFEEHDPADPARPTWWITPGGAIEGTESEAVAAERELLEETGIRSRNLLGPFATHAFTMTYKGEAVRQVETFFTVRGEPAEVTFGRWTAFEREVLLGGRWYTVEELTASGIVYYPPHLPAIVADAVRLLSDA